MANFPQSQCRGRWRVRVGLRVMRVRSERLCSRQEWRLLLKLFTSLIVDLAYRAILCLERIKLVSDPLTAQSEEDERVLDLSHRTSVGKVQ